MRNFPKKLFAAFLAAAFVLPVFAGCGGNDEPPETNPPEVDPADWVDYVAQTHFDPADTTTKKQKVTVRLYIDGDTTHFDPVGSTTDFDRTQGYIKARYMAVNTPESTGDIEKWGKTASNFTKAQLTKASNGGEIYVESDNDTWNLDSTQERWLVWIWYRPAGETEFRNLNLELLQEGYGKGSAIVGSHYESVANLALIQAQNFKLHVWSPASTVDENYFEGDAEQIDLRELRFHAADYADKKVRVEGTVAARASNTAYLIDKDVASGVYYGFSVYYGFKTGKILDILTVGNRVSVWGTVTEFNGTYQISGVDYNPFDPEAETNTYKLQDEPVEVEFPVVEAADIVKGKGMITAEYEVYDKEQDMDVTKSFDIDSREALISTTVTVEGLTIQKKSDGSYDMYTTDNGGNNDGAISIYCKAADGTAITIRTDVLKKKGGALYTEQDIIDALEAAGGGAFSVKGMVDKYTNNAGVTSYQVFVHKFENLIFGTAE